MQKFILSVTVQNNAGVLARVSSLFGRRGYNIDSLTVSATNDPRVSRMSIIVQGDEVILDRGAGERAEPHRRLPRRYLELRDCGNVPLRRHRHPQIITFCLIDGHLTAD